MRISSWLLTVFRQGNVEQDFVKSKQLWVEYFWLVDLLSFSSKRKKHQKIPIQRTPPNVQIGHRNYALAYVDEWPAKLRQVHSQPMWNWMDHWLSSSEWYWYALRWMKANWQISFSLVEKQFPNNVVPFQNKRKDVWVKQISFLNQDRLEYD